MNKNFLPYFNSLNKKEKTFWLDCSKEELIDHFIANVKNGEILLHRIDKTIENIKTIKQHYEELKKAPFEDSVFINDMLRQSFILSIESYLDLFLEILGGKDER